MYPHKVYQIKLFKTSLQTERDVIMKFPLFLKYKIRVINILMLILSRFAVCFYLKSHNKKFIKPDLDHKEANNKKYSKIHDKNKKNNKNISKSNAKKLYYFFLTTNSNQIN